MELSLQDATRERLASYLAHRLMIDEFKSWLVAVTWDRSEDSTSPGIRFTNEIKLALAEHFGGFRSDAELRESLAELLNRTPVETC